VRKITSCTTTSSYPEHGIWRQVGRIDLHHLLPVESNTGPFCGLLTRSSAYAVPVPRSGPWERLRRVGLDRRRALLAFEPVELVAQALVLCLAARRSAMTSSSTFSSCWTSLRARSSAMLTGQGLQA